MKPPTAGVGLAGQDGGIGTWTRLASRGKTTAAKQRTLVALHGLPAREPTVPGQEGGGEPEQNQQVAMVMMINKCGCW